MADSLVSPRGRPQASPTVALPRIPAGPLPQTPSQGDDPEKRPFRPRREVLQQPAGPPMPSPSGAPPSPGKFIAAQKPASRGRPSTILLGDHNGPAVRQPMMGRGGPPSQPPHHHQQQQPAHAQGQEHGSNGNGVAAGAGPRRAPPPRGGPPSGPGGGSAGAAGGGSSPVPRLAAPEGARPTQPLPAAPSPRKPLQRLQSDPAISTSPAPSSPPSSSSSSSSSSAGSPSVNMKTLPPRRQLVKRDAIDPSGGLEFPIKVWLPDDTQSLFKCPHKCTCYEFIEIIIEHTKQTYMGTLLKSKKLELRVDESNSPLDISKPLFELPYVQDTLEKKHVPTLRLCLTGANHRQSFIINSNTAVQAETARLTIQFQVHFLLPGGKNLSLNCHGDQTLHQIKEFVCAEAKTQRGLLMLAAKHYMFLTWHGKQELTIEAMPLEQVSYIHKSRKRCIIPKLILQQRPCKHFTEKELEKRGSVNQLIGKPIISTHSDEEEISAFRQTMARLRYLERLRKKDSQSSSSSAENSQSISRNKGLQASIPNKTMVLVTLPELTVKKTIQTLENETANQFLERIFDKHYAATFKTKTAQDYILKVAGLKEFITGDHPVNTFDYVRRKVLKNEKVELVVVEKASVANEAELQEEDLEEQFLGEGEEMLEACAFHYSHDEIAQKNISWDQKTYISIWELTDQPFRLKIMGVESLGAYCTNFSEATRGKFSNFYVTAGLYHGGELLDSLNVTFTTTIDPNPRWNQWLIFKICTANIPRATRVCFTLYATNRHEASADRKGDIPVAWVNCQLINFKHELLTGVQPLNMWPDAEANPIGTCVQNSSSMAPVLFVTFEEFQLPVVFPDDPPSDLKIGKNEVLGEAGFEFLQIIPKVENLILKDPLYPLTAEDRANIWKCRYVCQTKPKSLPKLIASIPQGNRDAILELHRLLATWKPLHHYDAMELLDSRFADSKVRSFAVKCLDGFEDSDLQQYLLQLVQVLKYEPYHDSALIRFLIRRALSSQHVGHAFFWYLKSEMHVPEICKRFGLFLEAYLYGCGQHLDDLTRQDEIMNAFCTVANNIKLIPAADRREVMLAQLAQIRLPDRFQLPLDRTWEASGLILEKCRFMDSKKLPLWLVFVNADPNGSPLTVIFKSGDDLRQDMLTLQIIRIMDQLWKEEGLDLQLSPYGCISTGDGIGMIEVVLNSATTAQITKESGGAAAAFKASPIADWLRTNNPSDAQYNAAVNRFILSCAGYCVATYVLGIGDRHNDNIMVSRNGRLFHIDFGHFLGNYKKKFGIKRERAKFVLTPDFAHVMGGVGSPGFTTFQNTCCRAFNILRKHASKFINLFAMMLSTGIPELREAQDIEYLRQSICFGMSDEEAIEYFNKLIHDSLGTFTTQVNNYIHILAH